MTDEQNIRLLHGRIDRLEARLALITGFPCGVFTEADLKDCAGLTMDQAVMKLLEKYDPREEKR